MTTKTKPKRSFWKSDIPFIMIMLAPTVIHLVLFWGGVQVETLAMAFTDRKTGEFTLLGNFRFIFDALSTPDSDLSIAVRNTFLFFGVGILLIPMTIFAAYMFYKKMAGAYFVRVILYLPGAISSMMMAFLFQQLLMPNGPIVTFLTDIGINLPLPLNTEAPLPMIIFFDVWIGLGGGLIVWLGAMGRISEDILEYGKLDGVGPVREFVSIIVPLIWPTFITMVTLQLIGIFGASGSVMLFTEGKYGTYTINYWLFNVIYKNEAHLYNYSVATGLFFTLLTLPIVVVGRIVMNKFGTAVEY